MVIYKKSVIVDKLYIGKRVLCDYLNCTIYTVYVQTVNMIMQKLEFIMKKFCFAEFSFSYLRFVIRFNNPVVHSTTTVFSKRMCCTTTHASAPAHSCFRWLAVRMSGSGQAGAASAFLVTPTFLHFFNNNVVVCYGVYSCPTSQSFQRASSLPFCFSPQLKHETCRLKSQFFDWCLHKVEC